MDKKELRQICLNNRNNLSDKNKISFSHLICEKLFSFVSNKDNIMSYIPTNNEVLIDEFNNRYNVAYPVITKDYQMKAYIPNNKFIQNKYNILEPDINTSILVNPLDLNIIIVPLVCFDERKNRIGYGKGYYDRYLSKCKNAIKIGVGYEIQKVNNIETNEYDIKLDYIVTEERIY